MEKQIKGFVDYFMEKKPDEKYKSLKKSIAITQKEMIETPPPESAVWQFRHKAYKKKEEENE